MFLTCLLRTMNRMCLPQKLPATGRLRRPSQLLTISKRKIPSLIIQQRQRSASEKIPHQWPQRPSQSKSERKSSPCLNVVESTKKRKKALPPVMNRCNHLLQQVQLGLNLHYQQVVRQGEHVYLLFPFYRDSPLRKGSLRRLFYIICFLNAR
jgi:hypothetical protein